MSLSLSEERARINTGRRLSTENATAGSKQQGCKCRPLPASCHFRQRINKNNNKVICRLRGTTWLAGKNSAGGDGAMNLDLRVQQQTTSARFNCRSERNRVLILELSATQQLQTGWKGGGTPSKSLPPKRTPKRTFKSDNL